MADVHVAAALSELGTATLGESGARTMAPRLRAVWAGARLAAPVYPVSCTPGDNLAVHVAVAAAPPGCALVVAVGHVPERGYWGEVLTTAALAHGLAGLVIDGCVRDVEALERHRFPVFSSGVALPGASKAAPGRAGAPTEVGGVTVSPGDWVVGDADGVVVVDEDRLDDVLAAGRARTAKEAGLFAELRRGATTIELLSLDPSPVEVTPPGPELRGDVQH